MTIDRLKEIYLKLLELSAIERLEGHEKFKRAAKELYSEYEHEFKLMNDLNLNLLSDDINIICKAMNDKEH